MDKNNMSLPIYFSINDEVSDKDNRFINVTIDVLHTGLNFNGSIFNKEVVDENIETIKNTPILGFIREVPFDGKDFKGHEYVITKTNDDGVKRKYVGSAYGMIPESCNPRWITKTCDDGFERLFLQVDGLIWTKFEDSSEILLKDIEKQHSMELFPQSIDGYEDENGNFVFTKFHFDGCCILGDDCSPAMQNSNIEVQFTMKDFVESIQSELNDKFTTFTKMVNEKTNQGGMMVMPNTDFTQTLLAQFEDISAMVRQYESMTDRWGDEYPRYYAVDIQENEVIVVDRMNGYNYFGLSFAMNGDKAEIDFESGKRKKLRYEDYVEGTVVPDGAFDFGKHVSEIEDCAFAKIEESKNKITDFEQKVKELEETKQAIEEDYSKIKSDYDEIKPKYDDYVQEEQARIEEELNIQKDEEFAKYENALMDDSDFEDLKKRKDEMTIKEIESECAILYARKNLAQTNFSKSNKDIMTAGLIKEELDKNVVETKYGCIHIGR